MINQCNVILRWCFGCQHTNYLRCNASKCIPSDKCTKGRLRSACASTQSDHLAAPCENISSGICGQRRPRSACASVQSDHGLHCPLTESLDTIVCISEEQMPGWDFAHAWDESESLHFTHIRRHRFAWRCPSSLRCPFIIPKTRLYNFDPLKPDFYVVKLGFTGVYTIFLISVQKHRLWVLVRNRQIYVLSRNRQNIRIFYLKIFIFWW